jgi:hypothetical protein
MTAEGTLQGRLSGALLLLSGLSLLGVGATGLSSPESLLAPLEIHLSSPSAQNEIRAAYGGMHLGVGLFLVVCALFRRLRAPALWLNLAFMGGLTLGRTVSLGLDGPPNAFVYRLWVIEAAAALVAAGILLRQGRTP